MKKTDSLDIDGHALRQLLEIYQKGNVSHAAASLQIKQSTLSYSLERMRQALNDPLFVRSGQKMVATPRMKEIAPIAEGVLQSFVQLGALAPYSPEEDTGVLRLAGNALERDLLFGYLFREMRASAAGIQLQVSGTGSWRDIARRLRDGLIDIAVFPRMLEDCGDIQQRQVLSLPLSVFYDGEVTRPPLNLNEYCARPHARVAHGDVQLSYIDVALEGLGRSRNVVLQTADFDSLPLYMKGTEMLVTLPSALKKGCFRQLDSVPVPFAMPECELAMFWHKRDQRDPRNAYWRNRLLEIANGSQLLN
ncbi:LysR family transcriptional regulator [Polycladidibacter hongkongensis]|uniref:LysR family transcriptional regulator n=1 Tax=Polycladidibacter hongkongensis TaxID=1647556 RepID=UPI00082E831D|nr:LysR family transcriptional regulator [Pseudovibrio hongkongensis]